LAFPLKSGKKREVGYWHLFFKDSASGFLHPDSDCSQDTLSKFKISKSQKAYFIGKEENLHCDKNNFSFENLLIRSMQTLYTFFMFGKTGR
jgi:hypothetical protein